MAFDGIVTSSIVNELKDKLIDGKINRIYQHEKDEILMLVRNKGENYKLLISSSSNHPRIYITTDSKVNPSSPPNFCMVLRKHLSGGRILGISQYEFDRIIYIEISSMDELGELSVKRLIIEIMGKHSNIILTSLKDHRIIDSIKRVNHNISRVRQILPGLRYENPPSQGKKNPLSLDKSDFLNSVINSNKTIQIYKFLYSSFQGLSPLISKEICFRSSICFNRDLNNLSALEIDNVYDEFKNVINDIRNESYKPVYVEDDFSNIIAFHALALNQFDGYNKYHHESISKILDTSFKRKDNYNRISQRSQSVKKIIQTRLSREINKLSKQKNELLVSQDRQKYKIYADLISSNIYKIPERSKGVVLENFYDENMGEILVPLDNKFSASENAQSYYKRFSKLKNRETSLLKQIPETESEILYLENVLFTIDNTVSTEDLDEIIYELIDEGYIKDKVKGKKPQKQQSSSPHQYISKDNFNIFVGKNNRQNEILTLKTAHKNDMWLHVQNMPGSHVIIKREQKTIPDSTLEEAALLAAYYSNAREGNKVLVDYTERKNVRKIPRSKPGMVRYDSFSTIVVSPSKDLINKIKKVSKN